MAILSFTRAVLLAIALAGLMLAPAGAVGPPAFASAGPQGGSGFSAAEVDRFLAAAADELGSGCGLLLLRDGKVLYRARSRSMIRRPGISRDSPATRPGSPSDTCSRTPPGFR